MVEKKQQKNSFPSQLIPDKQILEGFAEYYIPALVTHQACYVSMNKLLHSSTKLPLFCLNAIQPYLFESPNNPPHFTCTYVLPMLWVYACL